MVNMERLVGDIRARHTGQPVFVGGALVNLAFCKRIGATSTPPIRRARWST